MTIILLELLSFFAWALPDFGNIAFFVILGVVLIVSLQDLRYGVAVALAELIIGSHGYLFSFGAGELAVSMRMGIFLVLITVGILDVVKKRQLKIFKSLFFWPLFALAIALAFALIRGIAGDNGYANTFFDANAFVYFLMVIPLWQAIKSSDDIKILLKVGVVALVAGIIKVFFLLYVFSHQFWWMLEETYRWVRDTRIGEITLIQEPFYRVFFQSQIFTIIAFLVMLLLVAGYFQRAKVKAVLKNKLFWRDFVFASFLFSSILISFSRSNWVGIIIAALAIPFVYWLSSSKVWKKILPAYGSWFFIVLAGMVIVTAVVLFPFPKPSGEFSAGSLLSRRALTFRGEAGVSSRWQLLDPLWGEVKENIIFGAGFGEEVTYKTEDPRILAQSPTGEYTTFTFEWGYLDLWLKLGLLGMLVYAYFVIVIIKQSVKTLLRYKKNQIEGQDVILMQGLLLGGIALLATQTFSPYLNHPLGIGYLLFWALVVDINRERGLNRE